MNENGFSASLGKILRQEHHLFVWKINDSYAGGVPDMFIEGTQAEAWIENKYLQALPKRDTTMIDLTNPKYLSQLQIQWLHRRWMRFADAYVILGHPGGCFLFTDMSWLTPISTKQLREGSISKRDMAYVLSADIR